MGGFSRHLTRLTRKRRISRRTIHCKFRARKRTEEPAFHRGVGSSIVPHLEHVRRLCKWCLARYLFPFPWIPRDRRLVRGDGIRWGGGGANGVSVAVGGARRDECEVGRGGTGGLGQPSSKPESWIISSR